MGKLLTSPNDPCAWCSYHPDEARAYGDAVILAMIQDALGYRWCEEHRYRGEFVNLAASLGWPALESDLGNIAQGPYYYAIGAVFYEEALLLLLYVALEIFDETQAAS